MPFAKRKPDRNPLQRLSDQRRSLALAGLAVGAVFSAAIFRRKRRGGEAELGRPQPGSTEGAGTAAAATATQAEPEAPEKAAASAAAPVAGPTAAASTASEPASPTPAEPASSSPVEPATGELSAEEASILAVLAQDGRGDDDRTVIAVATSLDRESADVADVLRKLSAEGVVAGELYTATGDKIWAVTERGVRRLGAQH